MAQVGCSELMLRGAALNPPALTAAATPHAQIVVVQHSVARFRERCGSTFAQVVVVQHSVAGFRKRCFPSGVRSPPCTRNIVLAQHSVGRFCKHRHT